MTTNAATKSAPKEVRAGSLPHEDRELRENTRQLRRPDYSGRDVVSLNKLSAQVKEKVLLNLRIRNRKRKEDKPTRWVRVPVTERWLYWDVSLFRVPSHQRRVLVQGSFTIFCSYRLVGSEFVASHHRTGVHQLTANIQSGLRVRE